MKLPEHKAGLYISYNEHKNVYETAKEWLDGGESWFELDGQELDHSRLKLIIPFNNK